MKQCQLQSRTNGLAGRPVLGFKTKCVKSISRGAVATRAIAEPSTSVPFLSSADHLEKWNRDSWRNYPALQQPEYPSKVILLL